MAVRVLGLKIEFTDKVRASKNVAVDGGRTKLVAFLESSVNPFHTYEYKHEGPNPNYEINSVLLFGTSPTDVVARRDSNIGGDDFRVCFRSFRKIANEYGKPCWSDFGSGSVFASRLVAKLSSPDAATRQRGGGGGFQKHETIELKMHTVDGDPVMAVLKVTAMTEAESKDVLSRTARMRSVEVPYSSVVAAPVTAESGTTSTHRPDERKFAPAQPSPFAPLGTVAVSDLEKIEGHSYVPPPWANSNALKRSRSPENPDASVLRRPPAVETKANLAYVDRRPGQAMMMHRYSGKTNHGLYRGKEDDRERQFPSSSSSKKKKKNAKKKKKRHAVLSSIGAEFFRDPKAEDRAFLFTAGRQGDRREAVATETVEVYVVAENFTFFSIGSSAVIAAPVVRTTAIAAENASRPTSLRAATDSYETERTRRLTYEKSVLEAYYSRLSKENTLFENRNFGCEKIDCPFYPSQVTVEDTQLFVPFTAYPFCEPPFVEKAYWKNALLILSRRKGFSSLGEYGAFFWSETTSVETRAVHAMALVCQYAHLVEYLTDQVVHPETGKMMRIELFGNAAYTMSDDCEGSALLLFTMFDDFVLKDHGFDRKHRRVHHSRSPSSSRPATSKGSILREMRRLLRKYVPFLCIEGVTSSHVQNQQDIKDEETVSGAHAAVKCLPVAYFKRCLANWRPDHPLANLRAGSLRWTRSRILRSNRHRGDEGDDPSRRYEDSFYWTKAPLSYLPRLVATDDYDDDEEEEDDDEGEDLPILLGEGTGMLNPGGEPGTCCKAHAFVVYSSEATKCAKKPLHPPKGVSPFYKIVLFGTTNRFVHDFGIAGFRFDEMKRVESVALAPDPNARSAEDSRRDRNRRLRRGIEIAERAEKVVIKRGVSFSNLVGMSESLCLVPYGDGLDLVRRKSKSEGDRAETDVAVFEEDLTLVVDRTTGEKREGFYKEYSAELLRVVGGALTGRMKSPGVYAVEPSRTLGSLVGDPGDGTVGRDYDDDPEEARCRKIFDDFRTNLLKRIGDKTTTSEVATDRRGCTVDLFYSPHFVDEERMKSLESHCAGAFSASAPTTTTDGKKYDGPFASRPTDVRCYLERHSENQTLWRVSVVFGNCDHREKS
jgi:hypothetical protein